MYSPSSGLKRCNLVDNVIVEMVEDEESDSRANSKSIHLRHNGKMQRQFNKNSREPVRARVFTMFGRQNSEAIRKEPENDGRKKMKTEEGSRQRPRLKTTYHSAKKYENFENTHFILHPARTKKNTVDVQASNLNRQLKSPELHNYIPHSSYYPS
jgi:hypothetical protein